mmetsp:Transcript_71763/g.181060  ORF Transcript_71763/g.181060 Transcript_71763/m.181060 type:complete len:83 (-) Transcript_71763:784-1032(-)
MLARGASKHDPLDEFVLLQDHTPHQAFDAQSWLQSWVLAASLEWRTLPDQKSGLSRAKLHVSSPPGPGVRSPSFWQLHGFLS